MQSFALRAIRYEDLLFICLSLEPCLCELTVRRPIIDRFVDRLSTGQDIG